MIKINNFSFRMSSDNDRQLAGRQNHKYQKFLNEIYTCIKERQFGPKRPCTPDSQALFNRKSGKDSALGLSTIQELTSDTRPIRVSATNKGNKFKNFLHALDEQQKKVSMNNMNLLGLEVKKVNYHEKQKRRLSKNNLQQFGNSSTKDQKSLSRSQIRRTINCQTAQEFHCKKMGASLRQIHHRPLLSKRHSFRTKEKPQSSKAEYKRKSVIEFQNPIYENRINGYKEFIFKVQTAHGFYVETEKDLDESFNLRNEKKYRAWIGLGNNGNLIKGLLKRRFWWNVLDQKSLNVNFIWTQLRNMDFMDKQMPSNMWVRDRTRAWGQENGLISSNLNEKRKKRRSALEGKKQQQDFSYKILTNEERVKFEELNKRMKDKYYRQKQQILQLQQLQNSDCLMHNHLSNNFYLGNKKALFYNLKQYYQLLGENVFTRIPLTFHIKKGMKDPQYKRFIAYYKRRQMTMKKIQKQQTQGEGKKKKMRNVWIVKPGQLTNRGNGITVIDQIYELNNIMKREAEHQNGSEKTFIVQLYLDRPLLYQKRKFDIRHFILITHINGLMRAYWFREGYLRTSSYEFDIQNFEREIHLTNDAIQKYSSGYGKYQPANKLSYSQFQRYLDLNYPKKKYNFQKQILPQMKQISLDAVKSSYLKISPKRLKHNFQIFGLDFMIDQNFKPWLIEINTNPCLEICCPLLSRILPQMVDQALRLSIDIVFPPPCHYPNTCKHLAPEANLQNFDYELIFDQKRDGKGVRQLYRASNENLMEEIGEISQDQIYQDNGKDIPLDSFL